jgi:hypothetical protein
MELSEPDIDLLLPQSTANEEAASKLNYLILVLIR